MQVPVFGCYSMQNFLELIKKKEWNFQGRPTKTHIEFPGVLSFEITLAMSLVFPRISKENPETSAEYLERHSFNHHSSSVLGAEIPCLLNWSRTSSLTFPKENVTNCIQNIRVFTCFSCFRVCNLKVFIFMKLELLIPFLM